MATISNTQDLSHLILNKVDSQETFQQMLTNHQVNTNELYLVQSESGIANSTLTIGTYTYNGLQDVTIPVYDGTYTWG